MPDSERGFAAASGDFKFAAAVASFGMQLRKSKHRGSWTIADIERVAAANLGRHADRQEFVRLVKKARSLLAS